ncbi:MAG: acyl carrier protein [Clostridia bacterium]|nr:acyl carrier protein [Clostridia bacterium]
MDILEQLNEIAMEYRGEGGLKRGDNFTDLGFDSLDKVELVMAIEDKFDITFPDDVNVDTVDDLIALIEAQSK